MEKHSHNLQIQATLNNYCINHVLSCHRLLAEPMVLLKSILDIAMTGENNFNE